MFKPKEWAKAFKEKGFRGAAITDHGTMGGALSFYKEMRALDMTPILGSEIYFNFTMGKTPEARKNCHLVLLAKNYGGLQNLFRLQKLSYTEGYYYRARIGYQWLREYSEGLICLTACAGGPLAVSIYEDQEAGDTGLYPRLHDAYTKLHDIFGDDLYVEFQGHNFEVQQNINRVMKTELIDTNRGKPIVTNDNHYILPEHAKVQEVLKMAAYANAEAAKSYATCDSLWLKTEQQVKDTFAEHHPDLSAEFVETGIENTEEVFAKCIKMRMPENTHYLPKFRKDIDSKALFKKIVLTKLKSFVSGREDADVYVSRFKKEFKVISKYKLEDYFLIHWDLVRFAAKNNIYVGLGRGSAAGCLISYLMGIVRVDPIQFDLIFERFLNEVRCETGELPDIDLDFESDNRQLIKNYIYKTYGDNYVCEVGTYGRMKLKTSLIDFGKAMGVATHREILNITTKLDTDDLEEAINSNPALKELCYRDLNYVGAVEAVQGQIKSQAVHPAGIIISPVPIELLTPVKTQKLKKEDALLTGKERILCTQSEDKLVVGQGLMKCDILGVKQYDILKFVIENSDCKFTRENYVEEIDYADKEVWKLFQEGHTDGVFQFSSDGMKELLQNMQPTTMDDLIAANALYRPGCLRNGWHNDYCNRKHGKEAVIYMHPIVEEITKDTYGILVYQEQVMAIINKLGGISMAESDIIRSALGKKDEKKLNKYGPKFISGASKHIPAEDAKKLWTQIMFSSEYNFNKSHSAAYSVLAYISQYLKHHYQDHFWAAACDWESRGNKTESLIKSMGVAKSFGVLFNLPTVNKSKPRFYVEPVDTTMIPSIKGATVHMPLTIIKGIGDKAANEMEKNKPYTGFAQFMKAVNKSKVKINNIYNMIAAGALDEFGDRIELMTELYATRTEKQLANMTPIAELNFNIIYYEALGFFEKKIKNMKEFDFSGEIFTETELRGVYDGDHVIVGGMVTEVRGQTTKRGDKMGFLKIADNEELINVTMFPDAWATNRTSLRVGNIIEIEGLKSGFGGHQNQVEGHNIKLLGEL